MAPGCPALGGTTGSWTQRSDCYGDGSVWGIEGPERLARTWLRGDLRKPPGRFPGGTQLEYSREEQSAGLHSHSQGSSRSQHL